MTTEIIILIAILIALTIGWLIGRMMSQKKSKQESEKAKEEAVKILEQAKKEAETIKKDKLLEAKEKYLQYKTEFDKEVSQRTKKVEEGEIRLKDSDNRIRQKEQAISHKEQALSQKTEQVQRKETELDSIKGNLNRQLEIISAKKAELEKFNQEHISKLENIAQLTAQEAKTELIEQLKEKAKMEAMATVKEIMDDAKLKANKEAKKIIIQSIQRLSAEQTIENTVSVFHLESDEQKGQIIGREGRNIRALEAACGVEIIVDDTPEAIVISGFDPVRREIARLSLQRLVTDGRIHPARIEEIVEKTKKQLEDQVVEIGERSVIELGIHGLHPELVRIVGRMRFRSSYGQNLLHHSKETANLCAIMASELGLNAKLAKRAGLLHDIGKVPEEETELSHALLGMKLAEKYGEHAAVCNAIGAHHDEIEMAYVISPIVQACDAISGSRPGARREMSDSYMKRLKDLENIALGYGGVEKAYAIQAGRELRVIVESEKVTDKDAEDISFQIAQKIQAEMQYPGQVRVTVIREKRAVSVAK